MPARIKYRFAFKNLSAILKESPAVNISDKDRYIIFSDLHLGDGGPMDDCRHNGALFAHVLDRYYRRNGFHLILNGDVEELQKFNLKSVLSHWQPLYSLFREFDKEKRLVKLVGNHDADLQYGNFRAMDFAIHEGLRLLYGENTLFIFHGHQTSLWFEKFNDIIRFFLRFAAKPLHIKNYSAAADSKKRYRTEKRVYHFSRNRGIISLIGHTHRPLFESLSKVDDYKMKIEELCREYPGKSRALQEKIRLLIKNLKGEAVKAMNKKRNYIASIYNSYLVVPCLFNSGCVIGKRGITGIEIAAGQIALVHWFDKKTSDKFLFEPLVVPEPLGKSGYFRAVIKKEQLAYIFTRIRLLS